jgi:hypothetical protein
MLTVHKFPIPLSSQFELELPVEHTIIKVAMQASEPMMWVLLETQDTAVKKYRFIVVGTGQPLRTRNVEYVGTFLTRNDSMVFHVFVVGKES